MKIGARVFKTGLAIALSAILSIYLIPDQSGALAAMAAIFTTKPSVKESYEILWQRVAANAIGGIIAVAMIWAVGGGPLTLGVAAVITIAVLNGLGLSDVLSLSVVTLCSIMLTREPNFALTAFYRVAETIIGVLVSFVINWAVYPPRYDQKFYYNLLNVNNELLMLIRGSIRKNISFSIMHRDLLWLDEQVAQVVHLFELMKNEVTFNPKTRYAKARRLVIYRHMVQTTQVTIDLVKALHENENVYHEFNRELYLLVRDRVEDLMVAHEQILMKFNGRVMAHQVNFIEKTDEYRMTYIESFFEQTLAILQSPDHKENDTHGVIHIMSAIYDYEESLTNLNRLIRIYRLRYYQEIEQDDVDHELDPARNRH